MPSLNHVDFAHVAVSFAQTKNSLPYGIFASVTPLRFKGGDLVRLASGKRWTIQRCYDFVSGKEFLYILNFYVPRFIELTLMQKLETIVHELYHISPKFDGDVRRFKGRCFAHGASQKKFDSVVAGLVEYWLKQNPPEEIWAFLKFRYRELTDIYGSLHGTRISPPKIIPCLE